MRHRYYLGSKRSTLAATLESVTGKKRRQDVWLAQYFAYRIAVWKTYDEKNNQARFAEQTGLDKANVSELANGKTASLKLLEPVALYLGPADESEFKQLARAWAEQYPSWKAGNPLPERITHTGGPLEDGPQGEAKLFSEPLRAAARAIVGLMKCKPEQARAAAELARAAYPNHEGDWLFWLGAMRPHIEGLMRSGDDGDAK